MNSYDVAVVGAGAAGLMCAFAAAQRGRRVLVIEHGGQAGAKILISGGGRCNFTNLEVSAEHFQSANPDFCKSALNNYSQWDFIAMLERHRIPYHEKVRGQLFCDGSAREILAMLLAACDEYNVDLSLGTSVAELCRGDHFVLRTNRGDVSAAAVVIATGGLSIPKLGATGFAYMIAERFGLKVVAPIAQRCFARSCGIVRQPALLRQCAVYPSRAFWPGDAADLLILARRRDHPPRLRSHSRR
jgi:predicted Rossmann fold flavoprotein